MIWAPQNWSLGVIIFNIVNSFVIKNASQCANDVLTQN